MTIETGTIFDARQYEPAFDFFKLPEMNIGTGTIVDARQDEPIWLPQVSIDVHWDADEPCYRCNDAGMNEPCYRLLLYLFEDPAAAFALGKYSSKQKQKWTKVRTCFLDP